jgi:hypothetical protein
MKDLLGKVRFEAEGGKGGDPPKTSEPKTGEKPPPTFDSWFEEQPDEIKGLVEGHVKGLKTALGSERDARDKAEKDLRDVAAKLEKGSEAQKQVLELADAVQEGNTKADFYEDAHAAGVSNLKLAWHIAKTEELFDKRGVVDFEKMKANYPELFGRLSKTPPGNVGAGGNQKLAPARSMNEFIRRQAGRG